MKKLIAIALALLLLCSLAACGEEKPVGKDDNMHWVWTGTGTKEGALSDDGYYYRDFRKAVLCYADLSGGGSVILCSKVGCSHNGSDCDAYIPISFSNPMFFWNDHIYYVDEVESGMIYRRDAAGMNMIEVGTPGQKYIEEGKSYRFDRYVQAGEYLYYSLLVQGRDKNETNISLSEWNSIGRIHLTTGKDEILVEHALEKNDAALWFCAAREGAVLFLSCDGVDLPRDDAGFMDARQKMKVTLKCWSEDTGEIKELFTKTKQECWEIQLVADGKIYYYAKSDREQGAFLNNYTYDLNTGKEEFIGNAIYYHYTHGYAMRKVDAEKGYQMFNVEKEQELPNEVDGGRKLSISAYSDKGCVVTRNIKENETSTSVKEVVYCYVTYEDMADGLQEADLIPLYSQKMD